MCSPLCVNGDIAVLVEAEHGLRRIPGTDIETLRQGLGTAIDTRLAEIIADPGIPAGTRLQAEIIKMARELDAWTDAGFYTKAQWNARGEEYGREAEFTLVMEGPLLHLLYYYTEGYALIDRFDALVESLGYCYEPGYHWAWNFYPKSQEES